MALEAFCDRAMRSKESAYQLHGNARKKYDSVLLDLARVVKFWPPIPQVRTAAQKWPTCSILDMVAVANGWLRPKTILLTPGCAIPPGTVLKRSHSDCGKFVILPPESIVDNDASATGKRQLLAYLRSWPELVRKTHSEEQRWVSQQYVETLVTLGEWRCFLVGGHVASIVHTIHQHDGDWEGRRVWKFMSLREIKWVPVSGPHYPSS